MAYHQFGCWQCHIHILLHILLIKDIVYTSTTSQLEYIIRVIELKVRTFHVISNGCANLESSVVVYHIRRTTLSLQIPMYAALLSTLMAWIRLYARKWYLYYFMHSFILSQSHAFGRKEGNLVE